MSLFGTDGVRGVANVPPLTPQWVAATCFHAGRLLLEAGEAGPVVLGRDTRRSGTWLAAAAGAGLASAGLEVRDAGVVPTPAVSTLVRLADACLGVVVSASHNPAPDNGLKFLVRGGGKVSPGFEQALEARLAIDPGEEQATLTGDRVGRLDPWPEGEDEYVGAVVEAFRHRLDLGGLRVLVDAAHGAAFRTAPTVLEALGAEVELIGGDPDGSNINQACGALHPEAARAALARGGGQVAILLDGDADRGHLLVPGGLLLDGDDFLFALATRTRPHPAQVVGTVMANLGLERALAAAGVTLVRAAVGDRPVRRAMEASGAPFGAEPSGHVIVDALGPTGDGLAACLEVLACLGGDLEALAAVPGAWERFPQVLLATPVARRPPLDEVEGFSALLAEVEASLGAEGRTLVRYSGTEPRVRVMVEARDRLAAQAAAERLVGFLEGTLGS